VIFFVIGVRLFFVKEKSTLGRGKFTTDVLESGTIFGATKERKNIFLIVLNLVNLLTTNLHINYLIFSPPPVFHFFSPFLFCFIGHSIWRIAGMLDPARTKIGNAGASAWNFTLFN